MALELKLRGKSTAQSFRSAVYYVDLTVRPGVSLESAITEARQIDVERRENGFKQEALDQAARAGFSNSAFEYGSMDGMEVVEEFYPETTGADCCEKIASRDTSVAGGDEKMGLRGKLERKVDEGVRGE